jgi:predicted nucleic acid-binding protein
MADDMASDRTRQLRVYLDVCCLQRPFDDQRQARIHLEAEAVKLILARIEHGEFFWISSEVVDDEISQNIDADRALKAQMLARHATFRINLTGTEIARGTELEKLGFAAFDALHLACAESGGADVFLTTDDKLLKRTIRFAEQLHVRVENPLKWLQNLEDK